MTKNSRAFTLTELLVVTAIMGILAALLVTGVAQAKGRARRIQCANNVGQIGMILRTFVSDTGKYPFFLNPHSSSTGSPEQATSWTATLQHELDGQRHTNDFSYISQGIWTCPAGNPPTDLDKTNYHSYGYNGRGLSRETDAESFGLGGTYNWPTVFSPAPTVSEAQVTNPSEMIGVGDGFQGGNGFIRDGQWLLFRSDNVTENWSPGTTDRSKVRHQGKANIFFCDGHVESRTLKFLFEDTSDDALSCWNRDHQPHREKL